MSGTISKGSPGKEVFADEDSRKCSLAVVFESFGKIHAETYPLQITERQWLHMKRNNDIYKRLEKNCSGTQTTFTNVEESSVIGLKCCFTSCRSPVGRSVWSYTVQKYFNDEAVNLYVVEHKLSKDDQKSAFSELCKLPIVSSGDATAFRTKDGIIVVTAKQNKADVSLKIQTLFSRRVSRASDAGYTSLEGLSIEAESPTEIADNERKKEHVVSSKKRVGSSSHSSILTFTFQGKKLKLLSLRPKAREYISENVRGTEVKFVVDTTSVEFQLVANEKHEERARNLLCLIMTIDFSLEIMEKEILQFLSEELIKRHCITKDKMLVETDTSANILSITATADIFDKLLQSCKEIRKSVITETHHISREVMTAVQSNYKLQLHNFAHDRSILFVPKITGNITAFHFTGFDKGIQQIKGFLSGIEKKIQIKNSTSGLSKRSASVSYTQTKSMSVSREVKRLLSVSDDALDYVLRDVTQFGVYIQIDPSGDISIRNPSEMSQERVHELIDGCFMVKVLDFDLFPGGLDLKPSQLIDRLADALGALSERVLTDANDAKNIIQVVYTKDVAENVLSELRKFMDGYMNYEDSITLNKEDVKMMWMNSSQLRDLERSNELEKVKITQAGSRLVITGAKVGVQKCVEEIHKNILTSHNSPVETENDDVFTEVSSHQIYLYNHMASLFRNNPEAIAYTKKVFRHINLKSELTAECSVITLTNMSPSVTSSRSALKARREKFPVKSQTMTARQIENILKEMGSALADKLLKYVDDETGRLVVVGTKEAVEACLKKMKIAS